MPGSLSDQQNLTPEHASAGEVDPPPERAWGLDHRFGRCVQRGFGRPREQRVLHCPGYLPGVGAVPAGMSTPLRIAAM
jgi:hypothetical protein